MAKYKLHIGMMVPAYVQVELEADGKADLREKVETAVAECDCDDAVLVWEGANDYHAVLVHDADDKDAFTADELEAINGNPLDND